MSQRAFSILAITLLAVYSQPLLAHTSEASGFVSGFLHPILGLDHLVAMVGVGILGAIIGGQAIWLLPVYFPLVMAVGGVLGIKEIPVPYAEQIIALSGVILGGLIIAYKPIPLTLASIIVAFFALFHGHAHGVELPKSTSPVEYCVGFVFGTGMLHASGIALSTLERWRHGKLALRISGGLVGLTGCYFLFI